MNDIDEVNMLLWMNRFLNALKMNLPKEDYEELVSLINKAHKNMLNKHWGISNAQVVDALSNGLNKNLKGESEE